MPDKIQVSIVGLSLLGASAGMGLRRHGERVAVIGHDRDPELAVNAKKLGAVEKTEWNLAAAVSGADRVILAVPLDEIQDALSVMAGSLKPGCVILALGELMAPLIAWGRELVPANAHLVAGHPIVIADLANAVQSSADLFKDRQFALAPDVTTSETAVQLATDLVTALDARPFFVDAYEHDALAAATEQTGAILAAALLAITSRDDNWHDLRKLASGQYYSSSLIMPVTGSAAAAASIANRDAVLRWLDALTAELGVLRRSIADADQAGLAPRFDAALSAREGWLAAYHSGRWEQELPGPELPTAGSMLKGMLGFGRTRQTPPADSGRR